MFKTNLADAKARLSEYLERALAGERIVICRHNEPVAELRPIASARLEPRPIGPLPGRPSFEVPASFFEPLSDADLDAWEGFASGAPATPSTSETWRVAEEKTPYKLRPRRPARPRR